MIRLRILTAPFSYSDLNENSQGALYPRSCTLSFVFPDETPGAGDTVAGQVLASCSLSFGETSCAFSAKDVERVNDGRRYWGSQPLGSSGA